MVETLTADQIINKLGGDYSEEKRVKLRPVVNAFLGNDSGRMSDEFANTWQGAVEAVNGKAGAYGLMTRIWNLTRQGANV